jgi:hypothetical protein
MVTKPSTNPPAEKKAIKVKTDLKAGCTCEDDCECYRTWGGQVGFDLIGYGNCLHRCTPAS